MSPPMAEDLTAPRDAPDDPRWSMRASTLTVLAATVLLLGAAPLAPERWDIAEPLVLGGAAVFALALASRLVQMIWLRAFGAALMLAWAIGEVVGSVFVPGTIFGCFQPCLWLVAVVAGGLAGLRVSLERAGNGISAQESRVRGFVFSLPVILLLGSGVARDVATTDAQAWCDRAIVAADTWAASHGGSYPCRLEDLGIANDRRPDLMGSDPSYGSDGEGYIVAFRCGDRRSMQYRSDVRRWLSVNSGL